MLPSPEADDNTFVVEISAPKGPVTVTRPNGSVVVEDTDGATVIVPPVEDLVDRITIPGQTVTVAEGPAPGSGPTLQEVQDALEAALPDDGSSVQVIVKDPTAPTEEVTVVVSGPEGTTPTAEEVAELSDWYNIVCRREPLPPRVR